MERDHWTDRARQWANVAAALFQIEAGLLMPMTTGAGERAPVHPLIQPADYAFIIWVPLFILALAYAAFQARPRLRSDTLLRRVGWFTGAAFAANGLFEVAVARERFIVAQGCLATVVLCAGIAFLRLARGRGAQALVAVPIGLFAGWVTAALVVNLAGVAVLLGVPGGGRAEVALGGLLLLAGGLFAAGALRLGATAPAPGRWAYAAAILWALAGIVVARGTATPFITVVALAANVAVVASLRARTAASGGSGEDSTERQTPSWPCTPSEITSGHSVDRTAGVFGRTGYTAGAGVVLSALGGEMRRALGAGRPRRCAAAAAAAAGARRADRPASSGRPRAAGTGGGARTRCPAGPLGGRGQGRRDGPAVDGRARGGGPIGSAATYSAAQNAWPASRTRNPGQAFRALP